MDFVADELAGGRRFRILTVVDQFSRMSPLLEADFSLTGEKVAAALDRAAAAYGLPRSITVDNSSEFFSKAMDTWAYRNGVRLDFIRPGKPIENAYIESFNGRLRDECLNAEIFFSIEDARRSTSGDGRFQWHRDCPLAKCDRGLRAGKRHGRRISARLRVGRCFGPKERCRRGARSRRRRTQAMG